MIIENKDIDVRFNTLADIIISWLAPHSPTKGIDILDFGCGEGITALSFSAKHDAKSVVGVDIMPDLLRCLEQAHRHLNMTSLPGNLHLTQISPGADFFPGRKFDVIYSWSVFEHVDQQIILDTFRQLKKKLNPGGFFFLQIAPLFYSSEGSHLYHKIPEAWAHLSCQESIYYSKLCSACSSQEEVDSLWSCYQTLNRLTPGHLIDIVKEVGFRIVRQYFTKDTISPSNELLSIFDKNVLTTNQIVLLLTH